MNYIYKANVLNVVDGDTIDVSIDLGFGTFRSERLRLFGINAWETKGCEREQGLIAKDYLTQLILDKNIVIQTFKDKKGKYGRYLAQIYLDELDINADLIIRGHATTYGG